MMTTALPDYHLLRPNVIVIPIRLIAATVKGEDRQGSFFGHNDVRKWKGNLSDHARCYIKLLSGQDADSSPDLARAVWLHYLAIVSAPAYLEEHNDGVREDLPRVPLPLTMGQLERSAQLGLQASQLIDVERPVLGVTTGKLRPEFKHLGGSAAQQAASV